MQKQTQDNDKRLRHLEDEIQRWRNLSNRENICVKWFIYVFIVLSNVDWMLQKKIHTQTHNKNEKQKNKKINIKTRVFWIESLFRSG